MEIQRTRSKLFAKKLWPEGKRFAITLGVDDVHPESRSDGERIDYGGEMDQGNFGQLTRLVEEVKELKTTLFVTPAWTMRPDYYTGSVPSLLNLLRSKRAYQEDAFRLDSGRHSSWCSWLVEKVVGGNFEVAVHGLTHFNRSARYAGLEFYGLSKEESIRRITRAEEILKISKIPFVRGFRQPGWCWSRELLDSLEGLGYTFFAGSGDMEEPIGSKAASTRVGYPGVSLVYPDKIPGYSFVTFAANAREGDYQRALEVAKLGGLVLLHTHIGPSAYGVKHLNRNSAVNLAAMIKSLTSLSKEGAWFGSLSAIAERFKLLENVRVMSERSYGDGHQVEIANENDAPVEGLTIEAPELNLAGAITENEGVIVKDALIVIGHIDARETRRIKVRT